MEQTTSADTRARWILERMRETPMRRGALPMRARQLKKDVARAISAQGAPPALAQRVAFQLASKFHRRDLFDEAEWRAIGRMLSDEMTFLHGELGMSRQRIITALPKLSASQIAGFLDELTSADRRIARTILHAALNTSEPLAIGRRYLADYRLVVKRLRAVEPGMARTVAAASFSAGAPLSKAMAHLKLRGREAR